MEIEELLAEIKARPSKCKLDLHRELILRAFKEAGLSYREIARLLEEKLGLHVAVSYLHGYIKKHQRRKRQFVKREQPLAVKPLRSEAKKASPAFSEGKVFHFDEAEPLELKERK